MPTLRVLGLMALLSAAHAAAAAEPDFVYVERWPDVGGVLVEEQSWRDGATGLDVRRVIQERHEGHATTRTHSVMVVCTGLRTVAGRPLERPFIVATQRRPDRLQGPADIDLLNRYSRVFVREPGGERIRLYENLRVTELAQLTRAFAPFCPRA